MVIPFLPKSIFNVILREICPAIQSKESKSEGGIRYKHEFYAEMCTQMHIRSISIREGVGG